MAAGPQGAWWRERGRRSPQPRPAPVAWACLSPSTPDTSQGAARGARAGALRKGIRNSEIKCISLGNAPHSADQIKRIKVQEGKMLFRTDGGKTSPKGREAETEEGTEAGSAVPPLRSGSPFLNYAQFWKSPPSPPPPTTTTKNTPKLHTSTFEHGICA